MCIDNDGPLYFETSSPLSEADAIKTVWVSRGDDGTNTVTVDFSTRDGSATAGQDFVSTNGTLRFLPGEWRQSFEVRILNDAKAEGYEYFYVTLSHPTGGAVLQEPVQAEMIAILDNDFGIQLDNSHYAVSETGEMASITVFRGDDGPSTVTVQYTASDGTATAGQDYVATRGRLTFAMGEVSKTFTVPILNVGISEGDETILLTLSNPTGSVLGGTSTATLAILDNDPGLQFSPTIYRTWETGGVATVKVLRGNDGSGVASVNG